MFGKTPQRYLAKKKIVAKWHETFVIREMNVSLNRLKLQNKHLFNHQTDLNRYGIYKTNE